MVTVERCSGLNVNALVVAVLAAIGVLADGPSARMSAQAQVGTRVQLAIEPVSLYRGRGSIVSVRAQIPDGHFIPAETVGSLTGAWLQPLGPWVSRELPTYPPATAVPLLRANRTALAYSGAVVFHMPVWIPPGVRGPTEFAVRFGYHLCDSSTCAPMAIDRASVRVDVQEPQPARDLLAYRVDAQRVALLTEMRNSLTSDPVDAIRPLAQFIPRLWMLPADHQARSRFAGDFAMGGRWTIASNGPRFDAVAEQPAIVSWRCGGGETPLAIIARVSSAAFVAERGKYFLARRDAPGPSVPSLSVPLQLEDGQLRDLEDLMTRQMRITEPTIFAPDPNFTNPDAQRKEAAYDRQVRAGQGRLQYHVEAYSLAPDDDARLYVRAYWQIGGRAQTGLTLWVRFDGRRFSVEQTDAAVNFMAWYLELKDVGTDVAARPEYAGMLLNVIPGEDGWAYVIMGRLGYESTGVSVWKYSPLGPQRTGIEYGYGC